MRQSIFVAIAALLLLRAKSSPIPTSSDGPGQITGPIVDGVLGTDNVKSADQIADTLGVANYGDPDNKEDSNALPQQVASALIGDNGIITDLVSRAENAERGLGCEQCGELLVGIDADLDQVGDSADNIANNLLGVCDEKTTPSDVNCQ
ncbi:hypothetical protein P7C70_g3279, partial [Phenoliferia sp. Uapishka_3]